MQALDYAVVFAAGVVLGLLVAAAAGKTTETPPESG